MFSGIVAETGRVWASSAAADGRLVIGADAVLQGVQIGDSIGVSGCCLTVVEAAADHFRVDLTPETRVRTTLGVLQAGDAVNLEASMALGDRVGGHLVSGHVDVVGEVVDVADEGNARRIHISAAGDFMALVVARGSVAIDGVSLTIVSVDKTTFAVSLIPHTLAMTTAGAWAVGTRVNLEADMIARYVARAVDAYQHSASRGSG